METKQFNIRLPEATREKLDWLKDQYGSYAAAFAVAVDQLYEKEQREMFKTIMASLHDAQELDCIQRKNYMQTWYEKDGVDYAVCSDENGDDFSVQIVGTRQVYYAY